MTGDDFMQQGGGDTANLLRNLVPSLNVNDQPISDAATLSDRLTCEVWPPTTLVMVNGLVVTVHTSLRGWATVWLTVRKVQTFLRFLA